MNKIQVVWRIFIIKSHLWSHPELTEILLEVHDSCWELLSIVSLNSLNCWLNKSHQKAAFDVGFIKPSIHFSVDSIGRCCAQYYPSRNRDLIWPHSWIRPEDTDLTFSTWSWYIWSKRGAKNSASQCLDNWLVPMTPLWLLFYNNEERRIKLNLPARLK